MYSPRHNLRLSVLLLILLPLAVWGEPATTFARVAVDGDDEPRALQMAIVTYVPESGNGNHSVDLVSAIHIGEKAYYAALNDKFEQYDTLLYELVAPQGTIVTHETERKGFISNAQLAMTRLLDLSFQLDEIDYTPSNFVHADLVPSRPID